MKSAFDLNQKHDEILMRIQSWFENSCPSNENFDDEIKQFYLEFEEMTAYGNQICLFDKSYWDTLTKKFNETKQRYSLCQTWKKTITTVEDSITRPKVYRCDRVNYQIFSNLKCEMKYNCFKLTFISRILIVSM